MEKGGTDANERVDGTDSRGVASDRGALVVMADIVERLLSLSPVTNAETRETMQEAAAEIERLRGRLEIDPSHPYDGIYCRDETIRGLEKQIERLRAGGCARDQGTTQYCAEAAKLAAEIERLRAALKSCAGFLDHVGWPMQADRARAALEGN